MEDNVALKIENLSKQYRLGLTGTGTISHDVNRWWHKIRGKEDPYATVGTVNDRTVVGGDYVWALQDINVEVKQGEVLGIIGKNGAGKSTLLKILSRITGPTTGSIQMRGRMASLLEVGTGFHPELTGLENVFLNGAILGMNKKEITAKLDDIVDFSGCAKYIDTPVKRYSSGMRVRLGFAVAAFLEPDILVVDEVLAVGDAEFQKQAIGKMKDVSSEGGRTILFVSHNMAAVRRLCDRAIVLDKGVIVFEGGTDESINYYLNLNSDSTNQSDLYQNGESSPISFSNVKFSGKENNENIFEYNENILIEIEVFKKSEIEYTYLGVIIEDNKGNLIYIASNDDFQYSDLHTLDNGKHKIGLELPSKLLMPGLYSLTFTLRSDKEPKPYHKIERGFQFTIEDTLTFRGQKSKYRPLTVVAPETTWLKK